MVSAPYVELSTRYGYGYVQGYGIPCRRVLRAVANLLFNSSPIKYSETRYRQAASIQPLLTSFDISEIVQANR